MSPTRRKTSTNYCVWLARKRNQLYFSLCLQLIAFKVSATPGKSKHYQTHVVGSGEIVLVDGPGLVIPDLRMTKPSMLLAGMLPIDTLTDPLPCVDLLLQKMPFTYVQVFGFLTR